MLIALPLPIFVPKIIVRGNFVGLWAKADELLKQAQEVVDEMIRNNTDEYGLLESARNYIIMARSDIEDDLK